MRTSLAAVASLALNLQLSSQVQGNVAFFDGSGWVVLGNGTDGQVLTTHAAGADPTWEDAGGGFSEGDPHTWTALQTYNNGVTIGGFPLSFAVGGSITSSALPLTWSIDDNQATALRWFTSVGNVTYVQFDSRNDNERVHVGVRFALPEITTVAMNDLENTLVLGSPTGAQTKLVGNVVHADPESTGASEQLVLPPEGDMTGIVLYIANTADGAEDLVIRNNANNDTICTISQDQIGIVWSNGTVYRGGIMPQT